MKYLDKRDNADIIEHIKRRYRIVGGICALLSLAFLLAFCIFGFTPFAARFGSANAVTAALLLTVLPVFLTGLSHKAGY